MSKKKVKVEAAKTATCKEKTSLTGLNPTNIGSTKDNKDENTRNILKVNVLLKFFLALKAAQSWKYSGFKRLKSINKGAGFSGFDILFDFLE